MAESTKRDSEHGDRWPLALLGLFVALAAVVIAAALVSERRLAFIGWLFGTLTLAALGALFVRAATRARFGKGAWSLVAATLLVEVAFAGIVLSYGDAATGELWGPFPAPTTWLLLIFYPSHLAFVGVFVRGFREWFFTHEDEQRFERIVRDRRERRE
jgi:hypothetical protein